MLTSIFRWTHRHLTEGTVVLLDPDSGAEQKQAVLRAATYYRRFFRGEIAVQSDNPSFFKLLWMACRFRSVLTTGKYREPGFPINWLPWFHRIDPGIDAQAAWDWHIALSRTVKLPRDHRDTAYRAFQSLIERLRARRVERSYVFGTGPSLASADRRDFGDGYRIVCNTIVRDAGLMNQLKPDIIVAADALYHFSDTAHACAFREDLKARMRELDVTFCYPALFEAYVRQEFSEFGERCIPIPTGGSADLTRDLLKDFRLPDMGNILGLMLLPLACNLAKEVMLLGFDGRKPNDSLFWSNSERHSYPSLVEQLSREYPAFYEKYVPRSSPMAYVQTFHGDTLDLALSTAEQAGWRFVMMAPSTSPALAKRPLEYANWNSSESVR